MSMMLGSSAKSFWREGESSPIETLTERLTLEKNHKKTKKTDFIERSKKGTVVLS